MEIDIKDYLSDTEIKNICKEEVKSHIKSILGTGGNFISVFSKSLAKKEVQDLIPNFKELISEHIQEQIKTITLADFFVHSYDWKSEGNKIFNGVLSDNKELIQDKIREIFKTKEINDTTK
jgi:DNA-binding cell septation regulator SpoVG